MVNEYRYPPNRILFPNALILLLPLTTVCLYIKYHEATFGIFSLAICLIVGLPITLWLIYNLSVRIQVDELQIVKKSVFGSKSFLWSDVVAVNWQRLNDADESNAKGPTDLVIKTRDGRMMEVFSIIQNASDGASAISELERIISTRVPATDGEKQHQQNKEMQKQLRLLVVGGLLGIVMGLIMLQRPIVPEKEKLGFITKKIGMSADAMVLMACGVLMVGCGIYKLRK